MTKVLGCKVENGLYELFKSLDGSISENLRKAAIMYYNSKVNKSVNHVNRIVKQKKPLRSYDDIVFEVDRLISRFFNDEGF